MEGMWRRMMKIIGHEEFVGKEGFVTDIERFENRDQVDPLVAEWMKQQTVDNVVTTMDENSRTALPDFPDLDLRLATLWKKPQASRGD